MFGLECLAIAVSFMAAVDTCWARRQGAISVRKRKASKQTQGPRPLVKDVVWAMAVGGSVTLRLVCAVQLSEFHATQQGSTLAASCWVSALGSLLSFLCLYPFLPRTWSLEMAGHVELAAMSGALSLPLFLAVAAMEDFLGLGFAQLILLLFAVLSAALMADSENVRRQSSRMLVLALGIGLVAVACGWQALGDLYKYSGPVTALLVAGVSAVVQAGMLADQAVPAKTARSCEPLCHVASAMAHMPLVLVFILSGDSFKMPRLADAHLWMFIAVQGIFYVRSLRPLTHSLGRVATLSMVLLGQLLTTFMMDTLQDGMPARLLNISMILFGIFLSQQASPKFEQLEEFEPAFKHTLQNTLNLDGSPHAANEVELSP